MTDPLDPRLARRMRRAIRRLPRDQRTIFCFIRFDDLSYEEIGERLSLTAKQVETLFAKALFNYCRMLDRPPLWWRFW